MKTLTPAPRLRAFVAATLLGLLASMPRSQSERWVATQGTAQLTLARPSPLVTPGVTGASASWCAPRRRAGR